MAGRGTDRELDRERGRTRDEQWVLAARAGDPQAFGQLYDAWIDRVHDLARRVTHDDAAAADVAQDAFLAAWRGLDGLEQPASFGGWLLRIARNRAYNHVRDEQRSRPVDEQGLAMIERTLAEDRVELVDEPAALAADAEVAALVWEAAEALGGRDAEVLDLTLRQGLDPAAVAAVVGTNRNAANQMVHRARTKLRDALCARVLWRGGEPVCGDLADTLAAAGVARFDAEAVRIATAHADVCNVCERRRRLKLDPAVLFGAVPVVAAPTLLRARVAHALAAEGVPMDGSAATGAPSPTTGGRGGHGGHRGRTLLRVVGAAALVVLLAVVAIVVVAEETDDAAPTRRATTATATPATSPALAPTTTTPGALVVEPRTPASPASPTEPTPPPTTAAPVVSAAMAVTPASVPVTYTRSGAPVLAWQVNGAVATVEVTGPGFSGSGTSGSVAVCPTASVPTWTVCTDPPGTYGYTLTARAADGAVLATASATLTVS